MSEFFGQIAGSLAGASGFVAVVPGMLAQLLGSAEGAGAGGLPALVAQFETAGFSTYVKSWLGQGEHMPLTADHITQVLPAEQIDGLAQKAGITPAQVSIVLAEILPQVISQAHSDGKLPESPAT